MKTLISKKAITQFVILTVFFSLSTMVAEAQQKYQIAGKMTQAIIDQQTQKLDDVLGHTLHLSKMEGVNNSTGETEFMDGARTITIVFSDAEGYNSTFQGYSKHIKKGDAVYFKLEGTLTTSLSEDGSPVTSFEASFSSIKGTGQYENIRCTGIYKGRYISGYIMTLEWEGEYWIEK